jgi:hypothetical protein
MAFQTDALMQLIFASMSADWPDGKACDVVKKLFARYKPKDTMADVEMMIALRQVTMGENEDPNTLFEKLSKIEKGCCFCILESCYYGYSVELLFFL